MDGYFLELSLNFVVFFTQKISQKTAFSIKSTLRSSNSAIKDAVIQHSKMGKISAKQPYESLILYI